MSCIIKIILSLLLGFCCAIALLQRDARFKHATERALARLCAEEFDFRLTGRVVAVNLFVPSIELENVQGRPLAGDAWSWQTQKYSLSSSWLAVLFQGALPLSFAMCNYRAHTYMGKNGPAIADHFQKLFAPVDLQMPVYLKSLIITDGQVTVEDNERQVQVCTAWQSRTRYVRNTLRTHVQLADGLCTYAGVTAANQAGCNLFIDVIDPDNRAQTFVTVDGACTVPLLPGEQRCSFVGSWQDGKTRVRVSTNDRSIVIDPISVKADGTFKCCVTGSLDLLRFLLPGCAVHGVGAVCVHADLNAPNWGVRATFDCADLTLPMGVCKKVALSCKSDAQAWSGDITIEPEDGVRIAGSWSYDLSARLMDARARLCTLWKCAGWCLEPGALQADFSCNQEGVGEGSWSCTVCRRDTDDTVSGDARISLSSELASMTGTFAETPFVVLCQRDQQPCLIEGYYGLREDPLLTMQANAQAGTWRVSADFQLLEKLLPPYIRSEVTGQGALQIEGVCQDDGGRAHVHLADACYKIPKMHNYVRSFDADVEFDASERKIICSDVRCDLHRGSIRMSRGVFSFADDWSLQFLHVPFLFEKTFVRWQQNLFAVLSGRVVFCGDHERLDGRGMVIIDRAQLKGNPLAPEVQRKMVVGPWHTPWLPNMQVGMDLHIGSRYPVHIKTAFLDAKARVDVHAAGDVQDPNVLGSIELVSGCFQFPYRALHITSGRLYFAPHQPDDPLIDLTAQGGIKKYRIIMRIEGSVSQPRITFESSPSLTQEQIIALLLAGSEVSSLQAAVPSLVMHNLEQVLFGAEQTESAVRARLHNLFKPLKYIRLVPSFADQTGRGGLRAGIEVDIGDRLHGLIQKNFSLPEDIRLEVNYMLTDDVSVRAIRDERGDLGAELEMRWKFAG